MSRMILQPLAGLANRLRAVASGRVFAETMGYRCDIQWFPNAVECACEAADLFTNLPSLAPEEIDEGAVRFARADQTTVEDMEAACRTGRPLLVTSFEKFRASSMDESDPRSRGRGWMGVAACLHDWRFGRSHSFAFKLGSEKGNHQQTRCRHRLAP